MTKVLVAVEANDESRHIMATAGEMALQKPQDSGELHILNVVRPITEVYADLNFTPFAEHTCALLDTQKAAQKAVLQQHLESCFTQAAPKCVVEVLEGLPASTIANRAEQLNASLIVMGLHNRQGLTTLLGSTTYGVLTQCAQNLLAVHPQPKRGSLPYQRVLICVDTSENINTTLASAAPLALAANSYQVISVQPPLTSIYASAYAGQSENIAYNKIQAHIEAETVARVRQATRQAGLSENHVHVPMGDARTCILQAAEDTAADLIITGTNARGPVGRLLLGSTVRGILDHAPCDVWVVHP